MKDDAEVGRMILKVSKWKEEAQKLLGLGRDLDELTIFYKLTEDRMDSYVIDSVCEEVKNIFGLSSESFK